MLFGYVRKEDRTLLLDLDFQWIDDHSLFVKMKDLDSNDTNLYSHKNFVYITKESEHDLDRLFRILKEAKIEKVAVETDSNRNWTLKKLMDEIEKEHEYLMLRKELMEKLKGIPGKEAKLLLNELLTKDVSMHRLKQIQFKIKKEDLK
ncbi:DUF3783 domain-containing protein [Floccifex sp.]|uniref:DUF3783 domain-containing protein n=1 Tax=Floccifex sp. TaxID=2815810 RepID=UPI003F01FC29